jgi:hypothetical protein
VQNSAQYTPLPPAVLEMSKATQPTQERPAPSATHIVSLDRILIRSQCKLLSTTRGEGKGESCVTLEHRGGRRGERGGDSGGGAGAGGRGGGERVGRGCERGGDCAVVVGGERRGGGGGGHGHALDGEEHHWGARGEERRRIEMVGDQVG